MKTSALRALILKKKKEAPDAFNSYFGESAMNFIKVDSEVASITNLEADLDVFLKTPQTTEARGLMARNLSKNVPKFSDELSAAVDARRSFMGDTVTRLAEANYVELLDVLYSKGYAHLNSAQFRSAETLKCWLAYASFSDPAADGDNNEVTVLEQVMGQGLPMSVYKLFPDPKTWSASVKHAFVRNLPYILAQNYKQENGSSEFRKYLQEHEVALQPDKQFLESQTRRGLFSDSKDMPLSVALLGVSIEFFDKDYTKALLAKSPGVWEGKFAEDLNKRLAIAIRKRPDAEVAAMLKILGESGMPITMDIASKIIDSGPLSCEGVLKWDIIPAEQAGSLYEDPFSTITTYDVDIDTKDRLIEGLLGKGIAPAHYETEDTVECPAVRRYANLPGASSKILELLIASIPNLSLLALGKNALLAGNFELLDAFKLKPDANTMIDVGIALYSSKKKDELVPEIIEKYPEFRQELYIGLFHATINRNALPGYGKRSSAEEPKRSESEITKYWETRVNEIKEKSEEYGIDPNEAFARCGLSSIFNQWPKKPFVQVLSSVKPTKDVLDIPEKNTGDTLLNTLVAQGQQNIALKVIKLGASMEIPNTRGNTPLLTAAMLGDSRMVQALANEGADLQAIDREGNGALALLLKVEDVTPNQRDLRDEAIDTLLSKGASIASQLSILSLAEMHGCSRYVEPLLKLGADPDAVGFPRNYEKDTPWSHRTNLLELFLQYGADPFKLYKGLPVIARLPEEKAEKWLEIYIQREANINKPSIPESVVETEISII